MNETQPEDPNLIRDCARETLLNRFMEMGADEGLGCAAGLATVRMDFETDWRGRLERGLRPFPGDSEARNAPSRKRAPEAYLANMRALIELAGGFPTAYCAEMFDIRYWTLKEN